MYLKLFLLLLLFSAVKVTAEDVNTDKKSEAGEISGEVMPVVQDMDNDKDKNKESDAKELSGMSIVGNDDAPKALYIVPWKSSDIGVETSLDTMLNESDMPVDREVFRRRLEFYQVSTTK